jgi:hypothetical protein
MRSRSCSIEGSGQPGGAQPPGSLELMHGERAQASANAPLTRGGRRSGFNRKPFELIRPPSRLMLTVLGGLAEFKRLDPPAPAKERERTRARSVKLDRKPKLTEHQKREAATSTISRRAA